MRTHHESPHSALQLQKVTERVDVKGGLLVWHYIDNGAILLFAEFDFSFYLFLFVFYCYSVQNLAFSLSFLFVSSWQGLLTLPLLKLYCI